ncbi:MAG: NAD(P)H-dependent oxidoreductase [Ilumatobacteraceae bacterium]
MNVLVVFCHPTHESFTGASLERVLAGLARGGHDVRITDLYAEQFQPELSLDERRFHLTDHREAPDLRAGIAHHLDDLRWAQALVLVYPTWWAGQPAMLKGWFDRVLASGVAWHLPRGARRIRPMLHDIRRLVVVTSHGSSKFVNALEGEGGKRVVGRALRVLCGVRCRTSWIALYGIDRADEAARHAFLDRVERRLSRL